MLLPWPPCSRSASSTPAVAQTQLYLLTSGFDEVFGNPECQPWDYAPECWLIRIPHPGHVIQLDVDRRHIEAIAPVSDAREAAFGPRPTPDGRLLLWSGSSAGSFSPSHVSLFDIAAGSTPPRWPPADGPRAARRSPVGDARLRAAVARRSGHRLRTRAHPNTALAPMRRPPSDAERGMDDAVLPL